MAAGELDAALLQQALNGLDAVGHLCAECEEPPPRRCQPPGGLLYPARRPRPGEGAGLLVDLERDPVGHVGDPPDVLDGPAVRFVEPADTRHVVVAERSEHQA